MGVTLWAFERTDDYADMAYSTLDALQKALRAAAGEDERGSGKLTKNDCVALLEAFDALESQLDADLQAVVTMVRPLFRSAADSDGDILLVAQ